MMVAILEQMLEVGLLLAQQTVRSRRQGLHLRLHPSTSSFYDKDKRSFLMNSRGLRGPNLDDRKECFESFRRFSRLRWM